MRNRSMIFVVLLLFHFCAYSQVEGLLQFTASYFRPDPFKTSFSSFVKQLMQDPGISQKSIRPRTDTSLFSFSGVYDRYNPFFFKPVRVEVSLLETAIQYSDSLPLSDTIFLYQVRAFADSGRVGLQEVQKEADKINRQYGRKFYQKNTQELGGEQPWGVLTNYFISYYGLAPLSVVWARPQDGEGAMLALVLRIKMSENEAVLVAPLDNP